MQMKAGEFSCAALWLALALLALPAHGSAFPARSALEDKVVFLRDPGGMLTWQDLLDGSVDQRFERPHDGVPSFGYTRDTIWLKVRVPEQDQLPRSRIAELAVARLNQVDWHVIAGEAGHHAPVAFSAVNGRYPSIYYEAPTGTPHYILLRVESETSIYLPVKSYPMPEYLTVMMLRDMLEYGFLGFSFALGVITLFLGIYHRTRSYLALAFCMVTLLAYYLIFNGYTVWLFPAISRWSLTNLQLIFAVLNGSAYLLFGAQYLRDAAALPVVVRILHGGLYAGFCVAILLAFLPFDAGVGLVAVATMILNVVGASCAFWHTLRERSFHSILLSGAWLLILTPIVLVLAMFHGLIPAVIAPMNILRILMPCIYVLFLLAVSGQLRQSRAAKVRLIKADQAATTARLQALRAQINPHFLFNTLTTIDALAHEAPARVSVLVEKLAAFLRLRLQSSGDSMITLEQELESVRAYLAIEKIRFEDRLAIEESFEPATLKARVPELIMQPLIENAIKYGQAPGLVRRVALATARQGDCLVIRIENSGTLHPVQPVVRQGVGLGNRNLSERLALLYEGNASFNLRESDGCVIATVIIPWSTAS